MKTTQVRRLKFITERSIRNAIAKRERQISECCGSMWPIILGAQIDDLEIKLARFTPTLIRSR